MIDLVKDIPYDGNDRLEALTKLFESVPEKHVEGLYNRLQPGARTDDFAQYLKDKFPSSRAEGLSFLRHRMPVSPAPATTTGNAAPAGGEALGESIAVAGCSLPSKDSGAPQIRFGLSMEGDGYLCNPKYWIVEYTLVKNSQSKTFTSSKSQPSAWNQTAAFLDGHKEWHGATLNIRIKIGQYGASAAINDVWNAGSAQLYAIDCLGAATLVQLRGIYLSYPESTRDGTFDRDYGSFQMMRFGDGPLPTTSLDTGFDVTTLEIPIKLSDQAALEKTLKPGDQVPISNPFMPVGPWRTENTIFVGNDRFFGHPFGVITRKQYAEKLAGHLNPQMSLEERVRFVLDNAYIASFSRARTRRAGQVPAKAGTAPVK
jgi:protein-glutamine gamma-glutamyltransferase-like protein